MGLSGYAIALQKAEGILMKPHSLSTVVLYFAVLVFLILLLGYSIKTFRYLNEVKKEFNNPIRLSFFPTISISLLLLSIGFLEVNMVVSKYLWSLGTVLHFVATVVILSKWVRQDKFEIQHFNPAWFIPIVGNILVPIAGTKHFAADLSWFFFSIGIVFWIVLFTIFLYRIIFHKALPEKLLPTFFILIAPPAVGFISYVKLNGMVDSFSRILYYFALFLVVFLIAQFKMFYKIKFYLSWWAYSFPIASATIATALMYAQTKESMYLPIFFALLTLLTLFILILLGNTLKAIGNGDICVKEE